MVFHCLGGAPGSPDLKIHSHPLASRAQTRTHFIRSIAPRVLRSPSITLVSVLSGIHLLFGQFANDSIFSISAPSSKVLCPGGRRLIPT